MKILLNIILIAIIGGCASDYSKFYTALPDATPEIIEKLRVAQAPASPFVDKSPSAPDIEYYAKYCYVPIGYSSFNSGRIEPEDSAIEQGTKVGADLVVIVNPTYTGSVTSHIPITTPTTSTSYTTGSGTAYGPRGTVTAYGNSQTTTYGSQTNYIPMTIDRYDHGEVYFVKRKYSFGANWRDLNNQEREQIQSNSVVLITVVVNDTPAFRNDILVGDIVTRFNGQSIYGGQAMSDGLKGKDGQEVVLTILRNGAVIEKHVILTK
jgi:hypothetical protein